MSVIENPPENPTTEFWMSLLEEVRQKFVDGNNDENDVKFNVVYFVKKFLEGFGKYIRNQDLIHGETLEHYHEFVMKEWKDYFTEHPNPTG